MKKMVSIALTALILCCLFAVTASAEITDPNLGDNRIVNIYEIATAPKIDGAVEEGEYGQPIAVWPTDSIMQSKGDYAENIDVNIYMCYDAEYLYYAVVTECDEPHVAFVEGEHYIFNAHHIMSLILPDDPTKTNEDGTYVYPSAEQYDWGAFYNAGYCYEWTMIYNSKKNAPESADHFGDITASAKISSSSANGQDTYEIAIPWSSMKSKVQPNALKGEDGTIFGFDCALGLTDVGDGYNDALGNYVYFGGCYTKEGKDLLGCAVVTCAGKYQEPVASEPESQPESEKPVSDTSSTEPTSDNGFVALAVIASIAVAGVIVVKKSR